MSSRTSSSRRGKRLEILLCQYREVYESYREHNKLVWDMLSIATLVAGALVVGAYLVPESEYIARISLLLMSAAFLIVLSFISRKHRYFHSIEQATLCHIEDKLKRLGGKRIQRSTYPLDKRFRVVKKEELKCKYNYLKTDYWYHKLPEAPYDRLSAHKLQYSTLIALGIALVLLAFQQNLNCLYHYYRLERYLGINLWYIFVYFAVPLLFGILMYCWDMHLLKNLLKKLRQRH